MGAGVTRRAEAFLGRRKVSSPEKFGQHARTELAEWQEFRIKSALGMQFRQTSRVVVVRPRWMPAFLYRRLLGSIVVETKDVEVR